MNARGGGAMQARDEKFDAFLARAVHGFAQKQLGPMTALSIPMFEETGLVKALFTTRRYGDRTDLKLSIARMGATEEIVDNFLKAFDCAGLDPHDTLIANAQHGTDVLYATAAQRGWGLFHRYTEADPAFDGMVSNDESVALVATHADCTPVYLLDPVRRAIGLCHAGWRSTVGGMVTRLIEAMQTRFDTWPADLLAAIGPHIGPCCFEVDPPVGQAFAEAFPAAGCVLPGHKPGKQQLDLTRASAYQLYQAGVRGENITVCDSCTCCEDALFFSYRRDGKACGAMASFLQLSKAERGNA